MNEWLIRQGSTTGQGDYLWEFELEPIQCLNGSLYHSGSPTDRIALQDRKCFVFWYDGQNGAHRFTSLPEAYRIAAKVRGRVIRLKKRKKSGTLHG